MYAGAFSGKLLAFNGKAKKSEIKAHEGRINCLYATGDSLVSGGHDGKVVVWNTQRSPLQKQATLDLTAESICSINPKAVSVCFGENGNVLVGTRGAEIIEFDTRQKAKVLMRGHFDSELWGLATHPTKPEIFTVGRDSLLARWDLVNRKQICGAILSEGAADAIAISNNG